MALVSQSFQQFVELFRGYTCGENTVLRFLLVHQFVATLFSIHLYSNVTAYIRPESAGQQVQDPWTKQKLCRWGNGNVVMP